MITEFERILSYYLSDGFRSVDEVFDMRVTCPFCGEKVAVHSRHSVSSELATGYARCSNQNCEKHGMTQVHNLSFSHCIEPSNDMIMDLFSTLTNQLPAQQKKELIEQLRASS